ncbi:TOMM precursor leader peptide-binding protein [Streptomyces scopuliridis]|uniref:TOMM leader peptide-binding protein n=1 Tax=Streptomyces scopuliridis TaxID=452529 RepID=A0ACD4ZXG6_9ACTN|nr:TOMM precursor leader peptide-binding protein [Streptomyces scopuliridis]WSC02589.1 TOMM precursor leader peptide-binding protein [Streptomyces scopuliridis]WSC03879.1 TOMM precursor leader peptide-binding protein [Streptomyces scopuliridis]
MGSATYETVASTRPRIRRDVLFTETPEGVLFHNADGGFQLTAKSAYRFATLIVPHLTGDHSVSEICQGLGDQQRSMVGELVKSLYERDFARPVPAAAGEAHDTPPDVARRFAPQIAYVDHYSDDAERRFDRFRTARVAVLGDDLVARWCVLSLIRNGCATIGVQAGLGAESIETIEAEAREAASDGCSVDLRRIEADDPQGPLGWADLASYDLVVVTGGPAAPQRVFPLLRAGVPEGRTLLPAWSYGQYAVVGPLMTPDTAGCWSCAVLRIGSHDGAAAAADIWSGLALPGSVPAGELPSRPLAAMIGNLLGYEIFRVTTGALPAETAGQLIIQDMKSLDVTAEPLLPHPRCPFCSGAAEDDAPADAVDLPLDLPVDLTAAGSDTPQMPTVDTAREADALVEELNRRSVLVRPRAGVFGLFADEPLTQIPLKATLVEFGTGHGASRRIAAFDVHHVAGARLRALNAAAGVYAEHVVPTTGILTSNQLDAVRADMPAVEPGALTLSGGSGTGGARVTAWTRAVSLLTKERILVPAAAVRTFGPHNADRLFDPTRAGTGAGATAADAAADGLLSALAHDALCRTLRGGTASRVPLKPLAEGEAADAELTFLIRSAAVLDIELDLLDLGEGDRSGAHVLLARGAGHWAVGSDISAQRAAVAALRDLLGQVQLGREETAAPFDLGDPLLRDLDATTIHATDTEGTGAVVSRAVTDWSAVLDRLRAAGRDALMVDTGSADLATAGIRTARVLLTTEASRGA